MIIQDTRINKPPLSECQQPRIAIVLAQLRIAGIQRMRLNIIRRLLDCGYDVDLVVGNKDGSLFESVPENVPVYAVAQSSSYWFYFGLLKYLRQRRPTHVLSSYEDISVGLILCNWLLGSPSQILLSTHNALSKLPYDAGWRTKFKLRLLFRIMRVLYPKARSLIAVSEGVAAELSEIIDVPPESIQVIYNPIIGKDFDSQLAVDAPDAIGALAAGLPLIGFFGRFHTQKRVDILIGAFARVRSQMPCKLILVGDGPELARLKQLADDLKISEDVIFFGFVQNPLPIMKSCDLTVLSSAYEGLGNVLVESMACGVQVISTDCPYGPSEILGEGRWGQLVPVGDVAALEKAMVRSLEKEYWVEPTVLRERALGFSAITATDKYLSALGLPARNTGEVTAQR